MGKERKRFAVAPIPAFSPFTHLVKSYFPLTVEFSTLGYKGLFIKVLAPASKTHL